jgi:hypothetical protein
MGITLFALFQKKKIPLDKLNYWNVNLQEAYYSPVEVKIKYEDLRKKT